MTGFKVVWRALMLMAGNPGVALRLVAAPLLICAAVLIGVFATIDAEPSGLDWALIAGAIAIVVWFSLYATVLWMRFVLLGETASAANANRLALCVGFVQLKVTAICIAVGLVGWLLFLMVFGAAEAMGSTLLTIVAVVLALAGALALAVFGMRLSLAAAAAAIAAPASVTAAWEASRGRNGVFVGALVATFLFNFLFGLVTGAIGLAHLWLGFALEILFNVATSWLAVSTHAVLYGHIVEGRPLDDQPGDEETAS